MTYDQIRKYSQMQEKSASQLIEMAIILERCAQFLQRAIMAIEVHDYEERFINTDKVMVIMGTLQSILAVDRSEEAQGFHQFFENVVTLLVFVNVQDDAALCAKIREKLIDMADLWRAADKTMRPVLRNEVSPDKPTFLNA